MALASVSVSTVRQTTRRLMFSPYEPCLDAARNAADAQAMPTRRAHNEVANILRVCANRSPGLNDTNGTEDRTNIVTELDELIEEIDAIARKLSGLRMI